MATDQTDDRQVRGALAPVMVVFAMSALMWVVELVDLLPNTNLDRWGIRPRQLVGLTGILTAPFLHAGLLHLFTNTIPFLVLGTLIALSGMERFLEVTAIVMLASGLGTWLIGPAGTDHIGASGVVFGYLTYLVGRGFYERKIIYLAGGLLVVMLYGPVLWGVLPKPGISWQGHLFGAAGGLLAARLIHGERDGQPASTTPDRTR
ncbi:MAG: rhomboid family intrarane serine protease [Acidimicrobiales bacterium]|nr:rhomboid family intrarane serine protease [Acidimicrobiales bacterium]